MMTRYLALPSRLLTLICLILTGSLRAEVPTGSLESLVIQEGGRKKPYLVFTEETLRSLSGKSELTLNGKRKDAMSVITGLWMSPDESWKGKEMILVSNRPLRQQIGLDPARKLYSWNELSSNEGLAKEISDAASVRRRDPKAKLAGIQKEASDVGMRMGLFEELLKGDDFRIIAPLSGSDWLASRQIDSSQGKAIIDSVESMRSAWVANDPRGFDRATESLLGLQKQFRELPPEWKISLEIAYQKAHPFRWAWILYAAAGIILLLSRNSWDRLGYRLAWVFAGGGFVLQAAGLLARVIIAGRPPVTNMYESVIWVAFGTILFALIFEAIYRAGSFLLGAVPVAVASLILADSQPVILDHSIHPLTPVLRDNFWLSTHVLSITLSYAAFALSLGVAHVALAQVIAGRRPTSTLYNYLYKTLQVGVLLLAVGTILGGVWANYSWGRFWDWDPKETWALTALLGYLFLLHGRISGLWGGFGLAVGSVIAFMSVLMAWYGVNFVLGAGLHSYGFGSGGFPLVTAFVGCEILFVTLAFWRESSLGKRSLP
jgi:ABC-type transport system involved in cytochrome c biogenesis permease subunit